MSAIALFLVVFASLAEARVRWSTAVIVGLLAVILWSNIIVGI
jgi:hypothetical protein